MSMLKVVFAILFLLLGPNVLAEIPRLKEGTEGKFGASLLEGLIANNQALKSFSVAYSFEHSVMPPGRTRIREEKVRCIRDVKRGRALLGRSVVEDVVGADGKMKTSKSTYVVQLGVRGEAVIIDSIGKRKVRLPPNVPFSRSIGMPTFHSVGFTAFPDSSSLFGAKHSQWLKQTIEQEGLTAKLIGNKEASVVLTSYRDGAEGVTHAWIFDLESVCPTKRRGFYFDTVLKRRVLKEEEVYTWSSFDGLSLPLTIRSQDKQKTRVEDTNQLLEYQEITDSEFHWESVGEEFEEEETSLEQFEDVNDVTTWIHAGFPKTQTAIQRNPD